MKTFQHTEPDWHCKCTDEHYSWDKYSINRVIITIDNQAIVQDYLADIAIEAVQMIYPRGYWGSTDWFDNHSTRYTCPKCGLYPHRIIPNPLRRCQ